MKEIEIHRDEVMLARLADHDYAGVGEDFQMMGNGGLGQVEECMDLAARELAGGGNGPRHPDPFPVRQRFQYLHQLSFVHRLQHIEICLSSQDAVLKACAAMRRNDQTARIHALTGAGTTGLHPVSQGLCAESARHPPCP